MRATISWLNQQIALSSAPYILPRDHATENVCEKCSEKLSKTSIFIEKLRLNNHLHLTQPNEALGRSRHPLKCLNLPQTKSLES